MGRLIKLKHYQLVAASITSTAFVLLNNNLYFCAMEKVNGSKQLPKGIRLRWTSFKDVTSVKISPKKIHGLRWSPNSQLVEKDANNNNSSDNFLIP